MKKTLIALAAVASFATSYAQVAITGGVDFTVGKAAQSLTDGSAASGLYSSDAYIDVSVTDDMGGGWKSMSFMEFNVDGSFQGGAYSGDKNFTLAGPAASLTLASTRTGGTVGMVLMAPVVSATDHWGTANAAVLSRSAIDVLMVKTTVAPGATLAYKYLEAGATGSASPLATVNVLSGTYTVGALALAADYAAYSGASYNGDVRNSKLTVAATYDAGVAKVGVAYDGGAAGTANSSTAGTAAGGTFFGVSAPLGQSMSVGLNYGKRDNASFTETGAQYNLSKKTFVTATYASFSNTAGSQDSYGLRLGHSF